MINDAGELSVLETKGYYLSGLQLLLFSSQAYLKERQGGQYTLEWNKSYLQFKNVDKTPISYQSRTSLPILRGFTNTTKTAKSLALERLTDSGNENLTCLQKLLLLWHIKWGHLGFQHNQWLGRCGIVGSLGVNMGSTKVIPPRCRSYQLGKQERSPKKGSQTIQPPGGILKADKLDPGDLVFSDQYESRLEGRKLLARGNSLSSQKYRGGTIFCDEASGNMTAIHQVGLTGTETVQANIQFEKEAASVGFRVKE